MKNMCFYALASDCIKLFNSRASIFRVKLKSALAERMTNDATIREDFKNSC